MQRPASSSSAGPTQDTSRNASGTLNGVPFRSGSCFPKIRHRALPYYFNRLIVFSLSLFPFSIKKVLPPSQPLDAHLDTIMRKPRLRESTSFSQLESVGPSMMPRALPYDTRAERLTCSVRGRTRLTCHESPSFINQIKHISKTFINLATTGSCSGSSQGRVSIQAVQPQSKTKCQLEMVEQTDMYYEDDDEYELASDSFILFGGRCVSIEFLQAKRTDFAKSYDNMFSTMYERPSITSGSVHDHGQPINKVTKGNPKCKESTAVEERPAFTTLDVHQGDMSSSEKRRRRGAKRARQTRLVRIM